MCKIDFVVAVCRGTSGIDIDLRRVDIDQCPQQNIPNSGSKPLNIFAGTDKCKQRTTMASIPIQKRKCVWLKA